MKSFSHICVVVPIIIALGIGFPTGVFSADKNKQSLQDKKKGSKPPSATDKKKGSKPPSVTDKKKGSKPPSVTDKKKGSKPPSLTQRKTILKPGWCCSGRRVLRVTQASQCSGSFHTSQATAKRACKPITGFCNVNGKTISRITKNKCIQQQGLFFIKRASAQTDLFKKKREAAVKKVAKKSKGGSGLKEKRPAKPVQREQQPSLNAASLIKKQANRGKVADLAPQEGGPSLRDPNGKLNPGLFDPALDEAGSVLPEEIDLGKLKLDQPREGNLIHVEGYEGEKDYVGMGTTTPAQGMSHSDIRDAYNNDMLDDGTASKILVWGSDDGPLGEFGSGEDDNTGAPSPSLSDGDEDDDMDDLADEGNVDIEEDDSEPEGGNEPDEFKSPEQLRGLTSRGDIGRGKRDGGYSGGGQRQFTVPGEKQGEDKWMRHKMEIQGKGGVDPEDGGPAEDQGAVSGEGLSLEKVQQAVSVTGSAASPPDGGQGPDGGIPPGPEYSEARNRAQASSSGQTSMGATGTSASPPDGGQGPDGQVIPPGPAFFESTGK